KHWRRERPARKSLWYITRACWIWKSLSSRRGWRPPVLPSLSVAMSRRQTTARAGPAPEWTFLLPLATAVPEKRLANLVGSAASCPGSKRDRRRSGGRLVVARGLGLANVFCLPWRDRRREG